MSTSTTLQEDLDKEPHVERDFPTSRLAPHRTESAVSIAMDAEANLSPSLPVELTEATLEKQSDPGPPPNGGWQAWLQVLGSFFLFFNSW